MRIILMLTGGVVLFLVVGIGYIWITTPAQLVEVAIIKADTKPYKVQPVNPGGEVINNIESSLLNTLDNPGDPLQGGEVLSPPDPTPELPPIDVTITADPATNMPDDLSSTVEASSSSDQTDNLADNTESPDETLPILGGEAEPISEDPALDEASNVITAESGQAIADNAATAPVSEDTTNGSDQATSSEQSDTASPETNGLTETADSAGVPIPKPSLNRVRSTTGTPLYRVQLAAFKNEQKAMQVAALLMEKHRSRLGQSTVGITLHDAKEQGIFWRVVTDPMPRGDASNLCKTLKSAGQDCILRKID